MITIHEITVTNEIDGLGPVADLIDIDAECDCGGEIEFDGEAVTCLNCGTEQIL